MFQIVNFKMLIVKFALLIESERKIEEYSVYSFNNTVNYMLFPAVGVGRERTGNC